MAWITERLLAQFAEEQTCAHRIFSSEELWVERFGDDFLISHHAVAVAPAFLVDLQNWTETAGLKVARIFSKHLPKQNPDRVAPRLLSGDASVSRKAIVFERGLKFEIDFDAGYSAGLFIDQRNNRIALANAAPLTLLNCFAYTCAFSVAAAATGSKTTSLDLSSKSLDRGKNNFGLNDLSLDGHRFIADDVLDVLPRLSRRNESYDAIILDPPTFSRGNQGRRWQVERHLGDLILAALALAGRNCMLLVSTNCARLTRRDLELTARAAVKAMRRQCDFHVESAPPDIPESAAPKTLWLMLNQ